MSDTTVDFDPLVEWPFIRILRFIPIPALPRNDDYLALVQQRKTVEKVTAIEQIATLDIEVRGQVYRDCPLTRYLTYQGGPEIIYLYWDEQAPDEDHYAASCAAYLACVDADHDPPRRWNQRDTGGITLTAGDASRP